VELRRLVVEAALPAGAGSVAVEGATETYERLDEYLEVPRERAAS